MTANAAADSVDGQRARAEESNECCVSRAAAGYCRTHSTGNPARCSSERHSSIRSCVPAAWSHSAGCGDRKMAARTAPAPSSRRATERTALRRRRPFVATRRTSARSSRSLSLHARPGRRLVLPGPRRGSEGPVRKGRSLRTAVLAPRVGRSASKRPLRWTLPRLQQVARAAVSRRRAAPGRPQSDAGAPRSVAAAVRGAYLGACSRGPARAAPLRTRYGLKDHNYTARITILLSS